MELQFHVFRHVEMPDGLKWQVIDVCTAAFDSSYEGLFSYLPTDAIHVMGHHAGKVISHVVITERWCRAGTGPDLRCAYFDAVATRPEEQGNGYGAQTLEFAIRLCAERFSLCALSADAAIGWYERLGFLRWMGPLSIETPDGLSTHTTPPSITVLVFPLVEHLDLNLPLRGNWRPGLGW